VAEDRSVACEQDIMAEGESSSPCAPHCNSKTLLPRETRP